MPNISLWFGLIASVSLLSWSLLRPSGGMNMLDTHGLLVVFGGLAAAVFISTPGTQVFSAARTLGWVLFPRRLPSVSFVASEIVRLAKRAKDEGGLLSLRDESAAFADGFLQRAISAALACGETESARDTLELYTRRRRLRRQEDANFFRTLGTLAPMFGLMGTLIGMLQVLTSMSEPTKLGPAMAMALSSAFMGIGISNFFLVPLAGQIRLLSMRETMIQEMIVEGVLDILVNKPPYQIELKMSAYIDQAYTQKPGGNI